jgi:hypothetical protein
MAILFPFRHEVRFITLSGLRDLVCTCIVCFSANMLSAQQWQPMGPEGGQITCGVSLGNTLLVGTGSGIYESVDGGATFKPKSLGMPSGNIIELFADGSCLLLVSRTKGRIMVG